MSGSPIEPGIVIPRLFQRSNGHRDERAVIQDGRKPPPTQRGIKRYPFTFFHRPALSGRGWFAGVCDLAAASSGVNKRIFSNRALAAVSDLPAFRDNLPAPVAGTVTALLSIRIPPAVSRFHGKARHR
jgi:hypothetical protein